MATRGLFTTDNVDLTKVYREIVRSGELYNEAGPNGLRALMFSNTKRHSVRVLQRSLEFKIASELAMPDRDRQAYVDFDLNSPTPYELREGFDVYALEQGVEAQEILDQGADAREAATRLQSRSCVVEMFTDGNWWDAAMTVAPPSFKTNTFATSHDHYLAYNVSGVPTLAHFSAMKKHILEHGYGYTGGLVGFINSANAEDIENTSEWKTTSNYVSTSFIDDMQKKGLWPSGVSAPTMQAVGVPICVEDWIPENYIGMFDLNVPSKLGRWRLPEGINDGIVMDTNSNSELYKFVVTMYRYYCAPTIVHRGAGCVAYLGSGTWADTAVTAYG